MIAELSLNNKGAQFVECMKNELFKGKDTKATKIVTWIIFALLGLSVIFNCTAYITGASSVLESWFNLPNWLSMLIYYVFAGFIVMFGMKVVGISEKISSYVLIGVILLFGVVMMIAPSNGSLTLRTTDIAAYRVVLGLFSIVSFAMSAVMSVPTVVKGLDGDKNKIRGSIVLSEIINSILITILTLSAVIGAGATNLSPNNPASLDLGNYLDSVMSSRVLGESIKIFGNRIYNASGSPKTKLFDGIAEVVKELKNRGYKIAVLSNKPQPSTDKVYEKYLKNLPFDMIVGENPKFKCKPDPAGALYILEKFGVAPENAYIVGDGETDVLTALNAKTNGIFALWGNRTKVQLKAVGGTVFAETPLDLLKLIP